jgi:polyphosphate kinase
VSVLAARWVEWQEGPARERGCPLRGEAMTTFEPEHFFNRELSWLEFNQRVLEEAASPSNPLLERVKFFCIVSSNLDEFFEVRVAGIKQQSESDVAQRSMDGRTADEILRVVTKRVRRMVEDQYRLWRGELKPALARAGIRFFEYEELSEKDRAWLERYYRAQVRPVLTPLAVDPAHPFPHILNKSLNVCVHLEVEQEGEALSRLAVVQVPRVLPRLVRLPREDGGMDFIFLGTLIGHYIGDLFPGTKIRGQWRFRVTRNSELYVDDIDAANLLKAVEEELRNRRRGEAVRLEVDADCPQHIWQRLLDNLNLDERALYIIDGPVNPTRLMAIYEGVFSPELRDPPFIAPLASAVRDRTSLFSTIRRKDILVHSPYENFNTVVDFLEQAARDPNVLAIKQTLYRTGGDARIVGALMLAAENGKQVTAVTELRARFDEANNIEWARRLEAAGVHVVYGIVGHKVHGKITLVVRKDEDRLQRYVHIGTGNYNPTTAKIYTDLSIFTADEDIGEDATNLFNLLTGYSSFQPMRKLIIAPFDFHRRTLELIARETANAQARKPARIIAKMNSLSDAQTIEALYRASQAGVKIDLIVRGICCLRPGLPGISENITVRSIVGRFLEHSRVFYYENGFKPEVYIGSGDWMSRNFFNRIEVVAPVQDAALKTRIIEKILKIELADNTKAWMLEPDGAYSHAVRREGEPARSSQAELMAISLGEASPGRRKKSAPTRTRMKTGARPR